MNTNQMEAGKELNKLIDEIMSDEPPEFWDWSDDIASAWIMVEKWRLFIMPWGNTAWSVSPERDEHLAFQNIIFADTMPLAVCHWVLENDQEK